MTASDSLITGNSTNLTNSYLTSSSHVVLKYANFRYRGNSGGSKSSLNYIVKLADPENPSLVQKSGSYLL